MSVVKECVMLTPVGVPRLSSTSIDDVIAFNLELERYHRYIEERKELGETSIECRKLKYMFDPELLKRTAKWDLKKKIDRVTEADLEAFLKKILSSDSASAVRLNIALSDKLVWDWDIKDPSERVRALFGGLDAVLEKTGSTMSEEEQCRRVIQAIHPSSWSDLLLDEIKKFRPKAKSNVSDLYGLMLEKMVDWERSIEIAEKLGGLGKGKVNKSKGGKPLLSRASVDISSRAADAPVVNAPVANANTLRPVNADAPQPANTNAPPPTGCMFCKGDHWVIHCPNATAEEKQVCLRNARERRDARDAKRSSTDAVRVKVGAIDASKHEAKEGPGLKVRWGGTVVNAAFDSNATSSIASKGLVDRLIAENSLLSVNNHASGTAILADNSECHIVSAACGHVDLQSVHGPKHIHNLNAYVIDCKEEMPLLIGRGDMRRLGIDPYKDYCHGFGFMKLPD
eukprot:Rmarinus@m.25678